MKAQDPQPAEAGGKGKGKVGADGEVDRALGEEQLLEVFKQTSLFSVRSVQNPGRLVVAGPGYGEEDAWMLDGNYDLDYYSESEDEEDEDDFWGERRKKKRGKRAKRTPGEPRPARTKFINFYNRGSGAFVRKRVKVAGADGPLRITIPAPPAGLGVMGRRVRAFRPRPPADLDRPPVGVHVRDDVAGAALDFSSARAGARGYLGVLINRGWEHAAPGAPPRDRTRKLERLRLDRLCPAGFVFIWVQKEDVARVMDHMYAKGFNYIENFTWVQMRPTNSPAEDRSDFFRRSHATLYFFRRTGVGKDIELRHQRNPDVCFDCVADLQGRRNVPEDAYHAIETLLPQGPGQLIELWAPTPAPRPGWERFVEGRGAGAGA